MKFRFTPEMFPGWQPGKDIFMAEQANAALDEHLKKCKKVYLGDDLAWRSWGVTADFTHSALLFDVEELKPKECEHKTLTKSEVTSDGDLTCTICGKNFRYELVEV